MSGKHHTVDEARELMAKFSEEDWKVSLVFAKTVLKNARVKVSARELLNEAVLRTLADKRHWKKGMSGPAHLFGAMKSILNAWNKSDVRRSRAMSKLRRTTEDDDELDLGYVDEDLRHQLHRMADQLEDDPGLSTTGRAVLKGIIAGQPPHEIMRDLKIDAKKFRKAMLALSNRIGAPTADEEEVS